MHPSIKLIQFFFVFFLSAVKSTRTVCREYYLQIEMHLLDMLSSKVALYVCEVAFYVSNCDFDVQQVISASRFQ